MIKESLLQKRFMFNENTVPKNLTHLQRNARQLFLDELHKGGRYVYVKNCPYCGHDVFRKISEIDRRALPADTVVCERCDGCFKSAILNNEANIFHYKNISYALRGKITDRGAMETLFQKRVKAFAWPRFYFINNFVKLTPGKDLIAEIGCNDGANLVPWKEKGFDVIGIDLDPEAIEFGRSKGLRLTCGDLLNHDFYGKRPALIILSHVLEHVTDIKRVLQKLREMILPNGYLFIESPGIRVQGLGDVLAYLDIEHNYNFDLAGIRRLLAPYSFRAVYEDEYIRVICTPNANYAPLPGKKGNFSMDALMAGVVSMLMKMTPYEKKALEDLLRESEGGNIGIKVFNRLQRLYYSSYYSFLSH